MQSDFIHYMLDLLSSSQQLNELKYQLHTKIDEIGVVSFIRDIATPLGILVGEKWQTNQLPVFVEHLYAAQMNEVLNTIIVHNDAIYHAGTPKVLLCTVTGERHTLGNMMVQALLCSEKAFCLNLGELSVTEIIHAASYYEINVVGISFSVMFNKRMMHAMVTQLRKNLSHKTELWIGGGGIRHHHLLNPINNIKVLDKVDDILSAYALTQHTLANHDTAPNNTI